ncbi:MAG TPA: gephyrin-like molybdotransferase Glp [bacterium]|nr:gephyrin-like molybdotransferase Glp [bacterium]
MTAHRNPEGPRGPQALAYAAALETVLRHCAPLATERVRFDTAAGRVLAEDVRAAVDDPPAAKSAMDGFALRTADTQAANPAAPAAFAFAEVVGAGHVSDAPVSPGGAVRIMTGALLPPGADAVVKQEDTQHLEGQRFAVTAPLRAGENVIPRGAILKAESLLLGKGAVVSPQGLGLLAGQGRADYAVYRRPRVGLLSLGDELVEPGRPLGPGQLYVSNLYALEALCMRYGAEPHRLGIAGDDPERIEAIVRGALGEAAGAAAACDVVLTLGGSHHGDFDFADDVLKRIGAALHFRRTRINMGGSTLFATRGETLFFGLPGTPMASWLAFEVLVRPALWKLAGRVQLERPWLQAHLSDPVTADPRRTNFIPARLELDGAAEPRVQALVRGSPMTLPASVLASGLIHWPADTPALPAGARVPVELLGEE